MAEQATKVTKEQVINALREVYDPEIPVNVFDLGLVYDISIDDENKVAITMTLTAPGCGMGPYIGQQAEWRIAEIEGVEDVEVEIVAEPAWSSDLITPEGKQILGIA
ncbi:MAG: metal-sulfur cluster assembly factor [Dehalococcoidia bacterium]|nr:metal-sulfur cluster assembly factor [Dehalococcoidia bacterium]